MKILADESLEGEIVARLRAEGHDVAYVPEASAGIRDDEVLARANAESRVLLTEDKDFGDLAFFYGNRSLGIVLVRAHGAGVEAKADLPPKSSRHTRTSLRGTHRTSSRFGRGGPRGPARSAAAGPGDSYPLCPGNAPATIVTGCVWRVNGRAAPERNLVGPGSMTANLVVVRGCPARLRVRSGDAPR